MNTSSTAKKTFSRSDCRNENFINPLHRILAILDTQVDVTDMTSDREAEGGRRRGYSYPPNFSARWRARLRGLEWKWHPGGDGVIVFRSGMIFRSDFIPTALCRITIPMCVPLVRTRPTSL